MLSKMLDNYKQIKDVCSKLGIVFQDGVYVVNAVHKPLGNLNIVPVLSAKKAVQKKMVHFSTVYRTSVEMMNTFPTKQSQRTKSINSSYKAITSILAEYNAYTRVAKIYPKEFVFTDIHKTENNIMPTATDVKIAFFTHETQQISALQNLQSIAKIISHKTDSLTEDDNSTLGALAHKLRTACNTYINKYNDFSINGSEELNSNMVESVTNARGVLSNAIGNGNMPEERGAFEAKDYDFVMNHCTSDEYIEDRGNDNNDSKIQLLQPDTVGQIADDVVNNTAHSIEKINKITNKAKSNLASRVID